MRLKTFATSTAILVLGTGLAFADCPDRSASAQQPGATGVQGSASTQAAGSGRIAKDGSTAPLQQQPGSTGAGTTGSSSASQGSGTTAGAAGSMNAGSMGTGSGSSTTAMNNQGGTPVSGSANQQGGVSKDGSTLPLAQAPGGGDTNRAMSGQDVQAQQKGQPTAQAKATDC